MLNILASLKSKLLLILGSALGVLIFYIGVMKRAALEKELKRVKSVSKTKGKVNEALKEGLENESKSITRGHFDD